MGYKIKLLGMYGLGWDSIALGGAPLFEGVVTARSLASWDDVNYDPVKKLIAIADAHNREKKIRDTVYGITMSYILVGREVIRKAVDEVGWDKLDGVAVYNQLIKLKNFAPLGGLNFWTFTPEIRSTRQGYISEIHDGKILPITKWFEFPDLRPGGPYTPK